VRGIRLTCFAIGALCALGCDSTSSSPTDPGGTPLAVIEGEIGEDATKFEAVDVGNGDTIRIRVDSLEFVVGEPPAFDLLLGVGIGILNAAGDACTTTSPRLLAVGEDWILHLSASRYCLNVSDPGIVDEGEMLAYRVLVFDAFD